MGIGIIELLYIVLAGIIGWVLWKSLSTATATTRLEGKTKSAKNGGAK